MTKLTLSDDSSITNAVIVLITVVVGSNDSFQWR